jgi:hypothetical protein
VEEDQYRETYNSVNELRCVYEKAINSRRCTCSASHRFNLADREGVSCQSKQGQQRCKIILELMRKKSSFALKLPETDGTPLPHAKEIKVQVGGLLGLQTLLFKEKEGADKVEDIDHILRTALEQYDEFSRLPYTEIVKSITNFKGRQRRSR